MHTATLIATIKDAQETGNNIYVCRKELEPREGMKRDLSLHCDLF